MAGNGSGGANYIYQSQLFAGMANYQPNQNVNRERSIILNHQRNLTEMALNRFEWKNLPDSVDARFLELTLFNNALAIFYKDERFDKLLAVRAAGGGYVNMLDNPVTFTVTAPADLTSSTEHGMEATTGLTQRGPLLAFDPTRHDNKVNTAEELERMAVPVWANALRTPDIDTIYIYATRLGWIDRTLEINTKNARKTKVLKGTQNTQLSVLNMNRQVDQGDEVIIATGPMADMDAIDVLDLGILPDSYEKLSLLRTRIWNEVVGLFGINHANQDKKERLVSAEVGANDEQVASMRYVALNARQDACKRINYVFGTDISVDFRSVNEADEAFDKVQKASKPDPKASNAENPKGEDRK